MGIVSVPRLGSSRGHGSNGLARGRRAASCCSRGRDRNEQGALVSPSQRGNRDFATLPTRHLLAAETCPFGNAAKPRWRRLIRGQGHGWRAAPRPRAGNPQRQPWVRFRSGRWRLSRGRVSPAEVRYAAPRRVQGLRCNSRASRPLDRAPPWPRGAAGKRGSETARSCGVRPCGSGS